MTLFPDYTARVALRKESVDRNGDDAAQLDPVRVALRKESVDRNRRPLPGNR